MSGMGRNDGEAGEEGMSRGLQILVFGVIALAQAVVILFVVPLMELHGGGHRGAADGGVPASLRVIPRPAPAGSPHPDVNDYR